MAITFYSAEFVVNGISDDDYAGAAAGLADGGFVLTYASFPGYAYMNRSYDGLRIPTAGPLSSGTVNGGVSGKNGGIAQLSNGMLVEVFSQSGPSPSNPIDVAVTTFPSNLSSFPTPINPGTTPFGLEYNPTVASNRLGGAIVVWRDDNTVYGRPQINIIAQVFDNNLNGGAAFVVSEPALSGGDQVNPDATSLSNGNYAITWQDNSGLDSSGAGIRARVFSASGGAASPEIAVNLATSLDQVEPVVAGIAGGRFVIVWQNQGNLTARMFNSAGSALTNEIAIAQFTTGIQSAPDVTALADGGFLVAWMTNATAPADGGDGSGTSIKARAFSNGGSATSNEILVNSVTTGDQMQPAVAALADGRVIVSWTDKSNTRLEDADVRAQILDPRTQGVSVAGTAGADKYVGSAFADNFSGLNGSDQLFGRGGNDKLNGGAGADAMYGGVNDDTYYVDDALDKTFEGTGQGTDTVLTTVGYILAAGQEIEVFAAAGGTTAINLTGNAFGQRINGNNGNNVIYGGAGNDLLVGYGGNDNIEGQNGNDTLKGVSGIDKFVFRQSLVATSGADHIADFGADDFIYFDHPSVTGPLNPAAFRVGTNALDANDRFIYYAPYKALYFDQDGNGAALKVLFAVFDNGYAPTAADIVLF